MPPSIKIQFKPTSGQLRILTVLGLVLLLFAASTSAFAQDAGFKLLDGIDDKFAEKAGQWDGVIRVYANRLFWMLATADFCFLCATFVLDKKEMDDMLASVIRKLMTLGFFWFVLKSSHDWIPQIINTFTQIGQQAGNKAGAATVTTPDGVASAGYYAAMAAFQALADLGTMEKIGAVFPAVLMALIIFLSFLWVAAQLLICKIETSVAVGAGIILLGFGGSKWTTDMASKYMQYSVATGLKLMLMYLLIGMGQTLFVDMHIVGGDQFFQSLFIATGTALTYGFLATKIPAIASAMMSGSPSLTAGDMTGAVIGAGAAIAGMGAAGMVAGKAGLGAATGGAAAATGVGQALSAGIASGLDHGKAGGALAAHALGEVASHGMGLASAGVGDMLKGGASNFNDRVGESAGGRVATSINAARGGSMAGVTAPAGDPASGSSGAASDGGSSGSAAPSSSSTASGSAPAPAGGAGSGSAADATSAAAEAANAATGSDLGSTGVQSGGAGQAGSVQDVAAHASSAANNAAPAGTGKAAAAPSTSASGQTQDGAPATSSSTGAGSQAGQRASQAAGASNGSTMTPQPSALAGNAGAAGGSTTQPGGEAPASTPLSSAGAEQAKGDASNGAVSGGKSAEGGNSGSGDRRPLPPLHERIQNLQGYVPDDAAHSATFHIDLKHTE